MMRGAALINMAGHIQIAREVLQETSRFSWRYIWAEEMAPRFTYVGKPAPDQHVLPETAETALPQPENIDVDTPQLSESASTTQIEVIVPAVQAVEVGKTNRLYDTPRAGEVLAQLVELICRSMERDPDGACMLPLRPDIDGDE